MIQALLYAVLTLTDAAPQDPPHATVGVEHIAVVGASASAGWGVVSGGVSAAGEHTPLRRHICFANVLDAVLRGDTPRVSDHSSAMFFRTPLETGRHQVAQAADHDPCVVVGIDFLFWFGYGSTDANGRPFHADELEARLQMVEVGLKQLDTLNCPVLVGDLPDVSAAVTVRPIALLHASQVPTPRALQAINLRIHEWAKARPHVSLIPLAATMESIKQGQPRAWNGHTWPASLRLLQFDQLHPTREGLIALGELTAGTLAACCGITDIEADPAEVSRALSQEPTEPASP